MAWSERKSMQNKAYKRTMRQRATVDLVYTSIGLFALPIFIFAMAEKCVCMCACVCCSMRVWAVKWKCYIGNFLIWNREIGICWLGVRARALSCTTRLEEHHIWWTPSRVCTRFGAQDANEIATQSQKNNMKNSKDNNNTLQQKTLKILFANMQNMDFAWMQARHIEPLVDLFVWCWLR